MTSTCRRDRKESTGSARARACGCGSGLLEIEERVLEDWRIGWTIRFGE